MNARDPLPANQQIRELRRLAIRDSNGQHTEQIEITWDDNTTTRLDSIDQLPASLQNQLAKVLQEMDRRPRPARNRQSRLVSRFSRRRKRPSAGGSRWGTAWNANQDQITVTWPTLSWASPIGFCGLAFCAIGSLSMWVQYLAKQRDPGQWVSIAIMVAVVSLLLILSARLFRETFTLNRARAERTRWPGPFRAAEAVPRNQVLNAILRLDIIYGKRTRRVGQVQVRVRRSDTTDWWPLGPRIAKSTAENLARTLAEFVDVDVQRSYDDF